MKSKGDETSTIIQTKLKEIKDRLTKTDGCSIRFPIPLNFLSQCIYFKMEIDRSVRCFGPFGEIKKNEGYGEPCRLGPHKEWTFALTVWERATEELNNYRNNLESRILSDTAELIKVIEVYENAFEEMAANLCDSQSDENPCSQMWYQDCIDEARAEANRIAGGEQ